MYSFITNTSGRPYLEGVCMCVCACVGHCNARVCAGGAARGRGGRGEARGADVTWAGDHRTMTLAQTFLRNLRFLQTR